MAKLKICVPIVVLTSKEFEMNRIDNLICTIDKELEKKSLSTMVLDKTSESLNVTGSEHATFQNLKSIAQMEGTISLEEAVTVYRFLGYSPSFFNKQPIAVKVAVTRLMLELTKKNKK